MSHQKDIEIRYQWIFNYNTDKYGNCDISEIKVHSDSFKSSLIPNVTFEITCCVSNSKTYNVILSKTPYTPVNATIAIKSASKEQIGGIVHVDRWTNNCILGINIENLLQDALNDGIKSISGRYPARKILFVCNITWRAFEKPKPQVLNNLCDRFKNFLTSPDLSDMTIVIDEKEIPVHKIILAACSPVLFAMFKADVTEPVNTRFVVTDIEVDIMEKVIEFMYTGTIYPIPEFDDLLSILEVADKYQIINLKELCEEKLSQSMTIDNVLKILERASLCG
ncbi:hypothetical protein PV326_014358, partial [Microctonus aethiopoides]